MPLYKTCYMCGDVKEIICTDCKATGIKNNRICKTCMGRGKKPCPDCNGKNLNPPIRRIIK